MDDTQEYIHPCTCSVKIQMHAKDTPIYKDVLQSTDEEYALWDADVTNEFKSLQDFGLFETVAKPQGVNILQSTWALKKQFLMDP